MHICLNTDKDKRMFTLLNDSYPLKIHHFHWIFYPTFNSFNCKFLAWKTKITFVKNYDLSTKSILSINMYLTYIIILKEVKVDVNDVYLNTCIVKFFKNKWDITFTVQRWKIFVPVSRNRIRITSNTFV